MGTAILSLGTENVTHGFVLFTRTAILYGGVMFLFCLILIRLNRRLLPEEIRLGGWCLAILV